MQFTDCKHFLTDRQELNGPYEPFGQKVLFSDRYSAGILDNPRAFGTRVHPMMVDNNSTIAVIEFPHFAGWTLNMYGWCTTTVPNVLSTTNLKLYPISFTVLFKISAVIIYTPV